MLNEKAGHTPLALIGELIVRCSRWSCIPLLCFLLLSVFHSKAQGLLFNSNDSLLLKRTSYKVFNNSGPVFHDRFQVAFDLSIWDKKHLGYVLTITDGDQRLYTLSYLYPGKDTGYLLLNTGQQSNKIKIEISPSLLQQRQWMRVSIDFNLQADSVYMYLNNVLYKAGGFGLRKSMKPGFTFGKFEYLNDVPAMAIKDLRISGNNQQYHFPLNEWKGEEVHTGEGKPMGQVDYPNWLINESYFWRERTVQKFEEVTGVCFIPDSAQLLMYGKHSMKVYDIGKDQVRELVYKNELPINMILGKSIYVPAEHSLYVYEANDVRKDDPTIAALDLTTLEWKVIGTAYVPEQRHHHNILYDSLSKQFHLFGGYGSFSYFNTIFRYEQAADNWKKLSFTGDSITPRFFSASGNAGKPDEVFIFGGFGNSSGQQIVGGKHTYDLYRVNLTNKSIKKLWERKISDSNFVPANNLILSGDKKHFYVICYPHHISRAGLQLYRFSIEDGSYEIVSSQVPVISEKIESDINLYLNQSSSELYCVVQEFSDAKRSTVKVFSLAYPPVVPLREQGMGAGKWWAWLLSLLALMAVVLFWFRKKKKNTTPVNTATSGQSGDTLNNSGDDKVAAFVDKNAIYILGQLNVFDKKGNDITHLFSPKIRQLFVLILLKTAKGGITSREISLALWPDKEVSKTKNIRGVNINHLRNAIADLEGIKLVFLNDSYVFEMDERLFCDYLAMMQEIKSPSGKDITPLFTRGHLLTDHDDPSLDPLRQGYEDEVIPFVLNKIRVLYQQQDNKTVSKLAETVLDIDPFNETAIQYLLAVLRRWKGADVARKKYETFASNYEKSLGVPYVTSFEKMPLPETDQPSS